MIVQPILNGGAAFVKVEASNYTGNIATIPYAFGAAQNPANNLGILFFVCLATQNNQPFTVTATYGGLPCTVAQQVTNPSGYGDYRSTIAILCTPRTTDTFSGSNLVVTFSGSSSSIQTNDILCGTFEGVLYGQNLSTIATSTNVSAVSPSNYSQAMPSITGKSGDAFVSFEYVDESGLGSVTTSDVSYTVATGAVGGGAIFGVAYKELTTTESDTITWVLNPPAAIAGQPGYGFAVPLTQGFDYAAPYDLSGSANILDISLTWAPSLKSSDGSEAPGYDIYRNGTPIAQFLGPSTDGYVDTVTGPGTYTYTVAGWNGTTDVSGQSPSCTVVISSSVNKSFYGKFVSSEVFPPTLLIDAKGIKPRIYMPKENVTVQKP